MFLVNRVSHFIEIVTIKGNAGLYEFLRDKKFIMATKWQIIFSIIAKWALLQQSVKSMNNSFQFKLVS